MLSQTIHREFSTHLEVQSYESRSLHFLRCPTINSILNRDRFETILHAMHLPLQKGNHTIKVDHIYDKIHKKNDFSIS